MKNHAGVTYQAEIKGLIFDANGVLLKEIKKR